MTISPRKEKIIQAVVDSYIVSCEPISSAQIKNDYLPELSSATIRNELAALEEYNDFILVSRNEGMVNKALEFLKQGKNVFYVVGTAHMLGDIGLVQKLTDAGYTVELVRFD